jgi:hypothetical protein
LFVCEIPSAVPRSFGACRLIELRRGSFHVVSHYNARKHNRQKCFNSESSVLGHAISLFGAEDKTESDLPRFSMALAACQSIVSKTSVLENTPVSNPEVRIPWNTFMRPDIYAKPALTVVASGEPRNSVRHTSLTKLGRFPLTETDYAESCSGMPAKRAAPHNYVLIPCVGNSAFGPERAGMMPALRTPSLTRPQIPA